MSPMVTNWKLFEDMHAGPDDLPWLNWLRRARPAKRTSASGSSASRPPAGAGLAR
jgi:hypothetical protein